MSNGRHQINMHFNDANYLRLSRLADASGKAPSKLAYEIVMQVIDDDEKAHAEETIHASDCALHNAPALPVGPCDCGAAK